MQKMTIITLANRTLAIHSHLTFILWVIIRHAHWIVSGERLGSTHTLGSVKMHLILSLHITLTHTLAHCS